MGLLAGLYRNSAAAVELGIFANFLNDFHPNGTLNSTIPYCVLLDKLLAYGCAKGIEKVEQGQSDEILPLLKIYYEILIKQGQLIAHCFRVLLQDNVNSWKICTTLPMLLLLLQRLFLGILRLEI